MIASRPKIHLKGERQSSLEQARSRLGFLTVFFVFSYAIVVARAADLGILQGELQADAPVVSYIAPAAGSSEIGRNDILDRNGVILARTLQTVSVYADPALVVDAAETAKKLVKIFPDVTYGALLKKLQSKKRFVWVSRNISPDQHEEVLELGHPAVAFEREEKRVYPQGAMAAHLVGVSGIDGQGLLGVERSFNKYLSDIESEPLSLTIDVRVQHSLQREINKAIDKHNAKGGAGIVMDVETGEILAAASLPDFDPNNYKVAKDNQKFNRVSLGVYELGSTFKIFSTAAYLEQNQNAISKRFDTRQPLEIGRFKIRDYHPEKRKLTLPEVFMHSSNIGSALMGQGVGSDYIQSFYKDLGLMDKPDVEISELGRPIIPSPWREVNTLTASYGHGIAVSPLQLVQGVSSVVNGGFALQPTIVQRTDGQADQKNNTEKNASRQDVRIVSPQTSHRIRQLMRLVVTEGTGSKADVSGFMVGGKTGTAEKPGSGGYNRKRLISSFVGVFPMNAPRYAVFVMVDEPEGIKETYGYATGGWVAAPAVSGVISSMVSIMGLKPQETTKRFEQSLLRFVKTKEQLEREKQLKEKDFADH